MKKILNIGIAVLLLFALSGCIKEAVELDMDGLGKFDRPLNFAGPIANINLEAADLFSRLGEGANSFIRIDDDGLVNIKYTDRIDLQWDDIMMMEDVNVNHSYPFILPLPSSDFSVQQKIKMNEDPRQRFDSMKIQTAVMSMIINFPGGVDGVVNVTFPELSLDGEVLSFDYSSSEASFIEKPLDGYDVDFSQSPTADSSYITMVIKPKNINGVAGMYNLNVDLSLVETVPEVTFGVFGKSTVINERQTISFGIFSGMESFNLIEFKNIMFDIDFMNYYGLDMTCEIKNAVVSSSSSEDSIVLDLKAGNVISVEAASYSENVIPKVDSLYYDGLNSNIDEAINLFPNKIAYDVEINTNPNNPDASNFVTQENKLSGEFSVLIPVWFKCKEYERMDTIHSFDINNMISDENMDYLDYVTLSFVFESQFPFDLSLQSYPINEDLVYVDSLFDSTQDILVSGVLNSEGRITEAGSSKSIDITLSKDDIQKYKDNNVKKLLISTKTLTSGDGEEYVKIFEDYGLDIHLSMEIKSDEL